MTANDKALIKILVIVSERYEEMFNESPLDKDSGCFGKFLINELIGGIHGEGAGLDIRKKAISLLRVAADDLNDIAERIEERADHVKIDHGEWDLLDEQAMVNEAREEYERCTSG